jgi:hypothetical protein
MKQRIEAMKPKLLLGLVLVLSGGLFGCSRPQADDLWPAGK